MLRGCNIADMLGMKCQYLRGDDKLTNVIVPVYVYTVMLHDRNVAVVLRDRNSKLVNVLVPRTPTQPRCTTATP
eukprot:1338150-Lingulodinium_polyedra.AAC.1